MKKSLSRSSWTQIVSNLRAIPISSSFDIERIASIISRMQHVMCIALKRVKYWRPFAIESYKFKQQTLKMRSTCSTRYAVLIIGQQLKIIRGQDFTCGHCSYLLHQRENITHHGLNKSSNTIFLSSAASNSP